MGFTACGSDDDGGSSAESSNPNSIIGTWDAYDNNGTVHSTYVFTKDGKCEYTGGDHFTYRWEIQGDFLILRQDLTEIWLFEISNGEMKVWDLGELKRAFNPDDYDVEYIKEHNAYGVLIKRK